VSTDHSTPTVVLPEAVAGPVDAVLRGAIELARAAAELEAGPYARVGEHLGVWPVAAGGGAKGAVHAFAATDPAYVGWYWAVEVARVPRSKVATVDDASLLPGPEAVRGPAWVPWSERLLPGDVGVGDILPTAADDPRLVLRMADTEGWVDDALWLELGLGRPRVMSALGREEAADRWYEGPRGPTSDIAEAAPATCDSCGFFVALVGTLGVAFGACANAMAPADGGVVARTYGCGAHSEALVVEPAEAAPVVTFGGVTPPLDEPAAETIDEPAVEAVETLVGSQDS
jgi:hypothetical protein